MQRRKVRVCKSEREDRRKHQRCVLEDAGTGFEISEKAIAQNECDSAKVERKTREKGMLLTFICLKFKHHHSLFIT